MRTSALAIVLLVLSFTVLGARIVGGVVFETAAAGAFLILCAVGLFNATIREVLLAVVAVALSVLSWRSGTGGASLLEALDLAAFFAAFIALLTGLKIAAERSDAVVKVGRYLLGQPVARRYVATASGGHMLGVFLNFGAISLLAPLIQSATRNQAGEIDRALERRQLSALLRGFSWILLWAPTTLTQAVLLTLFSDLDQGRIILLGLATSALMMMLGFVLDRYEWRATGAEPTMPPRVPTRAVLTLSGVCGVLIGGTLALMGLAGFSTALALMIVAPLVTIFWYGGQGRRLRDVATFWPALRSDATGLARSAIALGLSGFIGRVLVNVLPVEHAGRLLDIASMPGWLFLAVLPVLITLGGQVALSPIILVVFLGQVVQILPSLPADPTNIVFALSAGWALSMLASPNATATLLIAATTRIAPTTLTWRWNLRYAGICYAAFVVIFVWLEA